MWHKLTLLGLLTLLMAAPSQADDPRFRRSEPGDRRIERGGRDTRRVWRLDAAGAGVFMQTRGNSWVQHFQGAKFYFREVARTRDYVELAAVGRVLPIRLYDDMLYQDNGDGWEASSAGHWE